MKQRLAKDTPESVIEEIFLEELKQKN
jgi:hypothetical protein